MKYEIGDRQLDLYEEPEIPSETCINCEGFGFIEIDGVNETCAACDGEGIFTQTADELAKKQFDDFDPPDRNYGGEL